MYVFMCDWESVVKLCVYTIPQKPIRMSKQDFTFSFFILRLKDDKKLVVTNLTFILDIFLKNN